MYRLHIFQKGVLLGKYLSRLASAVFNGIVATVLYIFIGIKVIITMFTAIFQ